jgi:hypothetical protein
VAPVVGGMQGSAIVFWKEATVGGSPAGGAPPDSATLAYVTATGLDSSFVPALDGLVVGLKRKGLWAKMTAIYPFIGGTAALHRWNLLNPQDSDGAYRLTFYGGVSTHSTALGYRANPPGGTSNGAGYADTHCVPLGTLDQDSTHLAFYSLEDTAPGDRAEMGCFNWTGTSGSRFHIIARYTGVNAFYYGMAEEGTSNVGVPAASGLFVATRTATAYQAGYRNGAPLAPSGAPSIGLPPTPIWIGAINYFANKTDIPCGFASIGAGLGVQENADLYNVVQAYQTALARQIGTPMVFEGGDPNGGWAIGKRTPVGGNTVSATWTPAAVGKRDPKGAAVTGNYTETVTATGKKVPKGAATSLSYVETVTAAGKKVPKGVATTVNHTWALTAQGITPLIGFNKGNALANHTWVPAAVGSRTPKGASTIGNVFVVAAAGKRVQKGTGTVTVQWLPAATGKKPQQGAGAVNYEWRGAAVGSRTPKARGDTDYWFSQVALGVSGIAGQVKGQWNGQEVVEMCYGDKQVIEWLLVPS